MCASHSVLNMPERRNESKLLCYDVCLYSPRGCRQAAIAALLLRFLAIWRSYSVHVGTRKMVNYAWAR